MSWVSDDGEVCAVREGSILLPCSDTVGSERENCLFSYERVFTDGCVVGVTTDVV